MTTTQTRTLIIVHLQQNGRYSVVYQAESGRSFVHARYDTEAEAVRMAKALARIHACEWEQR